MTKLSLQDSGRHQNTNRRPLWAHRIAPSPFAASAAALTFTFVLLAATAGRNPAAAALAGASAQDAPQNDLCPVMTDEKTKPEFFVDYQGRRIWFCCENCIKRFNRRPEAYLDNLDAARKHPRSGTPDGKPARQDAVASDGKAAESGDRPAAPDAGTSPDGLNGVTAEALGDLLFAADNEDLMLKRRALRLKRVPKPAAPPALPAELEAAVHNDVDRFIIAKWLDQGPPAVAPTRDSTAARDSARHAPPVCDDATFVRRAYLDIIGVIPTIEQARAFVEDSSPDKRERLIDRLLARNEDYAAHWTPFWQDALGSATTALQGGIPTRGDYTQWIYDSFLKNRPFDVMAAELIDPSMPGAKQGFVADANGRKSLIAYVRNESHKDTLQTAANVAQVFLGTAMKCASCHSHFENPEWPQKRFLGFAGLFSPNDLELIRCEQSTGEIVPARFAFDVPGAPSDVPDDVPGRLRRAAQLITDPLNPRFAKSIVNRLWKRYLGLGLFEPADDSRLDHPPSHPELLDWLAYDFMQNGYDLKHTIKLILMSRTYQLRYDPALEDHFDVGKPTEPRYYRSPSLRRLTAEQLIDSVRLASAQSLPTDRRAYLDKASTPLTRALGKPASRNEISTARPDDVAVVQALELLNGEDYHRLVYSSRLPRKLVSELRDGPEAANGASLNGAASGAGPDPGQAVDAGADPALAVTSGDGPVGLGGAADHAARAGGAGDRAAQAVDQIYWAAVSRPPSEAERRLALEYLNRTPASQNRSDDRAQAREIAWFDDDLPPNAQPQGSMAADSWKWITADDGPVFSGRRAHTQNGKTEPRAQHFALGAEPALEVGSEDVLFVYVYIDPANPPKEIMIQWYRGDWDHRAYWGENVIPFGDDRTASRWPMGALPQAGKWARLEVPAADVNLGTSAGGVTGISFDQAGGTVYWDKAGVVRVPPDPARQAVCDILWALFTSPEFQYVR